MDLTYDKKPRQGSGESLINVLQLILFYFFLGK